MDTKFKKLLSAGLLSFSADTYKKGKRADFNVEISDVKNENGKYHDEWAAHQNGGGQELVETSDGKIWTRVYAGGSLDVKNLSALGITSEDVSNKIKFYLGKMGKESRFDEDKKSKDGDWEYLYTVFENSEEIPVIFGREEIKYNGKLVFIHFIINSPVI